MFDILLVLKWSGISTGWCYWESQPGTCGPSCFGCLSFCPCALGLSIGGGGGGGGVLSGFCCGRDSLSAPYAWLLPRCLFFVALGGIQVCRSPPVHDGDVTGEPCLTRSVVAKKTGSDVDCNQDVGNNLLPLTLYLFLPPFGIVGTPY